MAEMQAQLTAQHNTQMTMAQQMLANTQAKVLEVQTEKEIVSGQLTMMAEQVVMLQHSVATLQGRNVQLTNESHSLRAYAGELLTLVMEVAPSALQRR